MRSIWAMATGTGLRGWRRRLAAAVLAVVLLAPRGLHAQEPAAAPPPEPTSVWLYALHKAIADETAANLADIPLYYAVLGAAPAASELFNVDSVVNVASAGVTYYAYEVAWHAFGPPLGETAAEAVQTELSKALLYRVVSSSRNVVLGYAFTGNPAATLSFVQWNNVTDTVIYVANEHGWYRWGPTVATVWGKEAAAAGALGRGQSLRRLLQRGLEAISQEE